MYPSSKFALRRVTFKKKGHRVLLLTFKIGNFKKLYFTQTRAQLFLKNRNETLNGFFPSCTSEKVPIISARVFSFLCEKGGGFNEWEPDIPSEILFLAVEKNRWRTPSSDEKRKFRCYKKKEERKRRSPGSFLPVDNSNGEPIFLASLSGSGPNRARCY